MKAPKVNSVFCAATFFPAATFFCAATFLCAAAGWVPAQVTEDSGGPLIAEQAAYDVLFYDLRLSLDPQRQSLSGCNTVVARTLAPLDVFVLDLDSRYSVDSVSLAGLTEAPVTLKPRRLGPRLWLDLPFSARPGDVLSATVHYHGQPKTAPNPPWSGGFIWERTADGHPWIAVSCQSEGADLWWPCKDHPSDEPDSISLRFTVPEPLVAVSNGRLRSTAGNGDGTRTFWWFASTPINNYGVTLYAAPYDTVVGEYVSVTGERLPITFWVLPQNRGRRQALLPEFAAHLRFYEKLLGPYPFRADKYGVVEAPYLGMEHQTAIAYGNDAGPAVFGYDYGFDALHLHELAHEWWGNMITASDWKDFWLHEGFATYMEALYAEKVCDRDAYFELIRRFRGRIRNQTPLAPREPRTAGQIYGGEIYYKGACVLHTLRYAVGDSLFFEILSRMLYPDPALRPVEDGRQCRLVDSDELMRIAEQVSGIELDGFFETYLRQPDLPRLVATLRPDALELSWEVTHGLGFDLPVEIEMRNERFRIDMSAGAAVIPIEMDDEPVIDPDGWLLMHFQESAGSPVRPAAEPFDLLLVQNYPNPFNARTVIAFTLTRPGPVHLRIVNALGEEVEELHRGPLPAGRHELIWRAAGHPSGVYGVRLQGGEETLSRKILLLR